MHINLILTSIMTISTLLPAILPHSAKAQTTAIKMVNATLNGKRNLHVVPSKTSSANDFDFMVGKWAIHNHKLKTRLNNCTAWEDFDAKQSVTKILRSTGIMDHFYATVNGADFEGMTLRLFDPKTRLWSIYWADSNNGKLETPVTGSFTGNIGRFYATDIFNGKAIIVMFNWDKTNPDKPVWSQAFSADNGKTWEWNWYMYFEKAKPGPKLNLMR